ncbi:tall aerial hyphae-4 [Verticillium dahliae]
MGTTVRAAQFIGLNQEECWAVIDTVERQTRRYVWWSVFIGAGFILMSWGTPPMLIETDCHVQQPLDVEDSFEQCPKFGSTEIYEDGQSRPVTVGSYNRFKAKITLSVDIETPPEVVGLGKVYPPPPELRSESHPPNTIEDGEDAALKRTFALQALTLQVSYDNVQILLFRPLISIGGVPRSRLSTRANSPAPATQATFANVPSAFINIAQQQYWTSATRTSDVVKRPDLLRLFQFGFPAIHVGVHAFFAGVMLGLLALLSPLSARGQESKRGIARIIQIPKSSNLRSHVWSQMTMVLTDLMHVIATEETKALIDDPAGLDLSETHNKPGALGSPQNIIQKPSAETEKPRRQNPRGLSPVVMAPTMNLQKCIAMPHGSSTRSLEWVIQIGR